MSQEVLQTRIRTLIPWALVGLLAGLIALGPLPAAAAASRSRTVRIEASSFAYQPAVVSVNRGDRVTLELVATDVVHGLYLDGYDLEVISEPGQTARLSFIADRPGSFRFRCAVACGNLHPFMIGKLKVGQNGLIWRAAGLSTLAALSVLLLYRQKAFQ